MSTEVTTEMMNEVIRRFIGLEPYEDSRYGTIYSSPVDGKTCFSLQYHTSWDWLMPVWKKAASILYDIRGDLTDDKYLAAHRITKAFIDACQRVDIESAHTAVYNAIQNIQWYNQQKQTNDNAGKNKG